MEKSKKEKRLIGWYLFSVFMLVLQIACFQIEFILAGGVMFFHYMIAGFRVLADIEKLKDYFKKYYPTEFRWFFRYYSLICFAKAINFKPLQPDEKLLHMQEKCLNTYRYSLSIIIVPMTTMIVQIIT